ncbi:hypothetical protein HI914_01860 [Erysiphe necator]|nr:hypothetical protein HI914_01860 [Erysiphe necator]
MRMRGQSYDVRPSSLMVQNFGQEKLYKAFRPQEVQKYHKKEINGGLQNVWAYFAWIIET